jgi:hypothetical protein
MGTAPAPAPPTQKALVLLPARTRGRSASETVKTSSVEGCPRERQLSGRAQGNTRHVTRVYLTRDGPRARARRCRARIMRYIDAILSRRGPLAVGAKRAKKPARCASWSRLRVGEARARARAGQHSACHARLLDEGWTPSQGTAVSRAHYAVHRRHLVTRAHCAIGPKRGEARDECELLTGAPGIGTCPGARRAILGMARAFA